MGLGLLAAVLAAALVAALTVGVPRLLDDGEAASPAAEPGPDVTFQDRHQEWAYLLGHDRAGRFTGAFIGSDREEGGTSMVRDSLADTGRGYHAYVMDYDVRESYVYAAFHMEGRFNPRLSYQVGAHRYFSFFVRGQPGLYLEVNLRDDEGRQSLWMVTLPEGADTAWTNIRLDVDQLRPGRGREPVRDARRVVFAVVRPDGLAAPLTGRLELALLSFTDQAEPLDSLPHLDPGRLPRARVYHALDGPAAPTPLPSPSPPPTPTTRYQEGGTSGLGVWVHDPRSDWLGLAHGLKAMGTPFRVVRSVEEAVRHPAVLVYPSLADVGGADLAALDHYLAGGGTVVAHLDATATGAIIGGTAFATRPAPGDARRLVFQPGAGPHRQFLADNAERAIPLARTAGDVVAGQPAALDPELAGATVVARYEPGDGAAALAYRPGNGDAGRGGGERGEAVGGEAGDGEAVGGEAGRGGDGEAGGVLYLWGVDMGTALLRAQNDRSRHLAEHYVNHYAPANDLYLRFLDGAYRAAAPLTAVRLRTAPGGYDVPVLLTHDDPLTDVEVTARFAASARERDVDATYFVLPKYNVPEFDDDAFLFHTVAGVPVSEWLRDVQARYGHDLESHSVSHAPDFEEPAHWPMGDGEETFQGYYPHFVCEPPPPGEACEDHPRVRRCVLEHGACGLRRTVGGSVMGELRVSRFLVEEVSARPVTAFRPGFLFWPHNLNEAMAAAGYRYSSIGTCNTALTHLPYQLKHGKGSAEVDVYEFCLTSDDQAAPLSDDDSPGGRLHQALDVVHRLARYGGVFVQLIHPDDTWSSWQENLRFQEAFIDRVRAVPDLATFMTVAGFGDFWRARDHVLVQVDRRDRNTLRVRLTSPHPVEGLSLDVPAAWRRVLSSSGPVELDPDRNVLVIRDRFQGRFSIEVTTLDASGRNP